MSVNSLTLEKLLTDKENNVTSISNGPGSAPLKPGVVPGGTDLKQVTVGFEAMVKKRAFGDLSNMLRETIKPSQNIGITKSNYKDSEEQPTLLEPEIMPSIMEEEDTYEDILPPHERINDDVIYRLVNFWDRPHKCVTAVAGEISPRPLIKLNDFPLWDDYSLPIMPDFEDFGEVDMPEDL